MKCWEYLITRWVDPKDKDQTDKTIGLIDDHEIELMNELGTFGWELFQIKGTRMLWRRPYRLDASDVYNMSDPNSPVNTPTKWMVRQ